MTLGPTTAKNDAQLDFSKRGRLSANARGTKQEQPNKEELMIVLGIICLILGLILSINILWTIGIILIVIGLILWILGALGHAVGGRSHWY